VIRRDDRGFTLTELLVCVTLLGVLVAALGAGVMHAVKSVPEASARSDAALNRARLVLEFADDVANATTASIQTSATPTPTCPGLGFWSTREELLMRFDWTDASGTAQATRYRAFFSRVVIDVVTKIEIQRATNLPNLDQWKTILTGYCRPLEATTSKSITNADTSPGAAVPSQYKRVRVVLRLRDSREDSIRTVNLEGALRVP
jgi:prepilin-type N-terminal cleavage/methylation domain-containing protein